MPQIRAVPCRCSSFHALHRVRPGLLAAVIGMAIAAICVAGVLLGHERDVAIFELLEEQTISALFTAALLVLAAYLALAARRTGTPVVWLAIAGFLLVMAADELFALHESVRSRLPGGRSSYLVFLPYAALGAYLWLQVLKRLRGRPPAVALWLGGAALWGASQLLDAIGMLEDDASADALPPMQVVEEAFEMAGSALFLLALLVFLQRTLEPSDANGRRRAGRSRANASVR